MLKHFDFEEFDCPSLEGSGLPTTDGGKMNLDFLHKLDEAREIAGVPFIITSGYRTPQHNLDVGGRVGSSHIKGLAVDISCDNSGHRERILTALIQVGFRRIGIAKSFIHTDLDHDKPNAIWLY
jgi:citrate lyase synthetase